MGDKSVCCCLDTPSPQKFNGMRTVINPSLLSPLFSSDDSIRSVTQLPFAVWSNITGASDAEETVGCKINSYHSNIDGCFVVGIWGLSLNLHHVHQAKHKSRWINTQDETDSVSTSSLTPWVMPLWLPESTTDSFAIINSQPWVRCFHWSRAQVPSFLVFSSFSSLLFATTYTNSTTQTGIRARAPYKSTNMIFHL